MYLDVQNSSAGNLIFDSRDKKNGSKPKWVRLLIRRRLEFVMDLATLVTALALAYLLRFDFQVPPHEFSRGLIQFPYVVLIQCVMLILMGAYNINWRYTGRAEARLFLTASLWSFLPMIMLRFGLPDQFEDLRVPISVSVMDTMLMFLGLTGLRVARCTAYERYQKRHEERKIRSVLVIGGAGYIGSALLPKLLNKGYRVRVLDLLLYGDEAIREVLDHPRLEIMQADFRRVEKVVDAMRDMDAVIHLGAIVGDPACALDEDLTIEINLMATRMIAEVAKGCGVSRFIFASTCSVYGMNDETLDVRSALNPVSLYARSKIASERVLMNLADPSFAPTFLRFGTIYGLSGRTRFDLVVNLLAAKAVVDGQITVMGGGQWRPFLHVDDAALAVFKALEAPLPVVRNQVFNVGSDEQNYTIQQVSEIIHRLVPTAHLINMGSDSDQRNYRVSFDKISKSLDFSPRWTIEQGVQQVIAAIACGVVKDYRDAKYSNIKFLSDESNVRLIPQNGWAYELINGASHAVEQGPRQLRVKTFQAS